MNLKGKPLRLPLWPLPLVYVGVSIVCAFVLPRLERAYLTDFHLGIAVASAQAMFSAIASGMIAMTGFVFALAFVMVQFSAMAYSPRLVAWLSHDPTTFHSLGIFNATFVYAIAALAWTDRDGNGTVPPFSTLLVTVLLMLSIIVFARLVHRINDIQIANVLALIGREGRGTLRRMFQRLDATAAAADSWKRTAEELSHRPVTQTLRYPDEPFTVAHLEIGTLVRLAQDADAVIVIECAVGDTLVENAVLMRVYGGTRPIDEARLRRTIRLARERTFEQDPKYPLRLLVDIAIKALSPAINDPTTAVQALDQIEDLLRRLGRRVLDAGCVRDERGVLRLVFPTPSWEDYLTLAFDEIRQYGSSSVQVMRRLRSALFGLAEALQEAERKATVLRYIEHLNLVVEHSVLDAEDQTVALQQDPQGLGLTRRDGERSGPRAA